MTLNDTTKLSAELAVYTPEAIAGLEHDGDEARKGVAEIEAMFRAAWQRMPAEVAKERLMSIKAIGLIPDLSQRAEHLLYVLAGLAGVDSIVAGMSVEEIAARTHRVVNRQAPYIQELVDRGLITFINRQREVRAYQLNWSRMRELAAQEIIDQIGGEIPRNGHNALIEAGDGSIPTLCTDRGIAADGSIPTLCTDRGIEEGGSIPALCTVEHGRSRVSAADLPLGDLSQIAYSRAPSELGGSSKTDRASDEGFSEAGRQAESAAPATPEGRVEEPAATSMTPQEMAARARADDERVRLKYKALEAHAVTLLTEREAGRTPGAPETEAETALRQILIETQPPRIFQADSSTVWLDPGELDPTKADIHILGNMEAHFAVRGHDRWGDMDILETEEMIEWAHLVIQEAISEGTTGDLKDKLADCAPHFDWWVQTKRDRSDKLHRERCEARGSLYDPTTSRLIWEGPLTEVSRDLLRAWVTLSQHHKRPLPSGLPGWAFEELARLTTAMKIEGHTQ